MKIRISRPLGPQTGLWRQAGSWAALTGWLFQSTAPRLLPERGGKGLFQMEANERGHETVWWRPAPRARSQPCHLPRDFDQFFEL